MIWSILSTHTFVARSNNDPGYCKIDEKRNDKLVIYG